MPAFSEVGEMFAPKAGLETFFSRKYASYKLTVVLGCVPLTDKIEAYDLT